ncbi:hypothetical protein NL676_005442 [Syzygium grande]|nr:hypothetical protein NL676_005442 [Syzygium grande]
MDLDMYRTHSIVPEIDEGWDEVKTVRNAGDPEVEEEEVDGDTASWVASPSESAWDCLGVKAEEDKDEHTAQGAALQPTAGTSWRGGGS